MKISVFTIIIVVLLLVQITIPTVSFAAGGGSFWENVFKYGDDFVETGKEEAEKNKTENDKSNVTAKELIDILYDVVQTLGVFVAIGVGGTLGIKFMFESAEDKAKIKESMVPYVVGCIVIFGAYGIWKMVISILSAM